MSSWSGGCIAARCDRGHGVGEVPAQDCSCGVYAYYDPCPRTASAATPDLIGGAVVLWGRIEAHIYGLRGKHARIVALELPFSRGRKRRAVIETAEPDRGPGGAAPVAEGGGTAARRRAAAVTASEENAHPGDQRVDQDRAGLALPGQIAGAFHARTTRAVSINGRYVAAIDQGTASSRCLIFDDRARIVSVAQKEHRQYFPRPGWVEHDPRRSGATSCSWSSGRRSTRPTSPRTTCARSASPTSARPPCCGSADTGAPVHNAINWQDTRTDRLCRELAREFGQDMFREKTGLPVTTYFSGPKIRWLLDRHPGAARARRGGRGAVRHDRLVADLEPVRAPRHRRDQRQPDAA